MVCGITSSNDGDVSFNHGNGDFWIVRLSLGGEIIWEKSYGGTKPDKAWCIIETNDKGFVVTGTTQSSDGDVIGNKYRNVASGDAWILKIDSSGNILWQKNFGSTHNAPSTVPFSIIPTFDRGYVISGYGEFGIEGCDYPFGPGHAIVIKLDSTGIMQWYQCYGSITDGISSSYSIIQTADSGYAFAGCTTSNDGDASQNHGGGNDGWLVKINKYGTVQWHKCVGGTASDQLFSLIQSRDGGFVAAGVTNSNDSTLSGNHGQSDVWVIKTTATGDLVWQKCFGGSHSELAWSLKETSDSGYVICGTTSSNDGDVSGNHGGQSDAWLLKVNNTGSLVWQKCLGGSGNDEGASVIITGDNSFIIAGSATSNDGDVTGNHGNTDYWVVKLTGAANGITPTNSFLGAANSFAIFPNPSTDVVHLQMWGEQFVHEAQFYNLLGIEFFPPYSLEGNTATINITPLPTGIYITKLFFSYQDYKGVFTQPLIIRH